MKVREGKCHIPVSLITLLVALTVCMTVSLASAQGVHKDSNTETIKYHSKGNMLVACPYEVEDWALIFGKKWKMRDGF